VSAQPAFNMPEILETLRPLSSHERFFWTYDKVKSFNFSVVASFSGRKDLANWHAAFAQAQKKHPLLNVSINDDDPHAPTFKRAPGFTIPLTVERRTSSTQWQRVVESEVAKPFASSTAPLMRAVLLEDDKGCDLILTAHHCISDGISLVALFGDLLAALSGETLTSLPVPTPSEDLVAHVKKSTQSPDPSIALQNGSGTAPVADFTAARPARSFAVGKHTGKPKIEALRFSPEQTTRLLRCSRQQQTTIGSVLLAAMASALRSLSPALKEADIHLFTPVDARPYLNNQADLVLAIGSAQAVSTYPDPDLWASARPSLPTRPIPMLRGNRSLLHSRPSRHGNES
jgi:NRPS condensation-like uncharacterized protein